MASRVFTSMLVFTVLGCWTTLAGQERTLTMQDVEEAIRWGEDGIPSPYLLHHAQTQGTTSNVVVGVVYTPFVRVAFLSKAAHDEGRRLAPEDIPASVLEPVVYIAFRWYCCDVDHGELNSYHPLSPFDYHIATGGSPPGLRGVRTRPLWVTGDLTPLAAFGGVPYSDAVLLAGYPISALNEPSDFVIYRNISNPSNGNPGTLMEIGRVTTADVLKWR
jgi:hypothetical protein